MPEKGSKETIVDRQTFHTWLNEYRGEVFSDTTVSVEIDPAPVFDLDGTQQIEIPGVPWMQIPMSIKNIIGEQYESAKQNGGSNRVDLFVDEDKISFELDSASVTGGVDRIGETYSSTGPELLFGEDVSGNGEWAISKSNAVGKLLMRTNITNKLVNNQKITTEDVSRVLATRRDRKIPATLPQLEDVAELLVKSRPQAIVRQFKA